MSDQKAQQCMSVQAQWKMGCVSLSIFDFIQYFFKKRILRSVQLRLTVGNRIYIVVFIIFMKILFSTVTEAFWGWKQSQWKSDVLVHWCVGISYKRNMCLHVRVREYRKQENTFFCTRCQWNKSAATTLFLLIMKDFLFFPDCRHSSVFLDSPDKCRRADKSEEVICRAHLQNSTSQSIIISLHLHVSG